jgi:hypothetical protein
MAEGARPDLVRGGQLVEELLGRLKLLAGLRPLLSAGACCGLRLLLRRRLGPGRLSRGRRAAIALCTSQQRVSSV